jgi:hypothetical protein
MKTLQEIVSLAQQGPLPQDVLTELLYLYDQTYNSRITYDRLSRDLKKDESEAEQLLIDQIRKQNLLNVRCTNLTVSLNAPTMKPHIQDWNKFYEYIEKEHDFSLLERRPSQKAITERWDDGIVVPGVEKYPVFTLSKTRAA